MLIKNKDASAKTVELLILHKVNMELVTRKDILMLVYEETHVTLDNYLFLKVVVQCQYMLTNLIKKKNNL